MRNIVSGRIRRQVLFIFGKYHIASRHTDTIYSLQYKVFHFYGKVEKSDEKYLKGDGTWKHRVSRYYLVGWHKLIENVISVVTTPAKMVRFTEWKIRNIYSNTVFFHRNFIFIEFYRKEFAIKPNKFYLCPLRSYLELPSARYIRGGHFWPLFSDSVF